MNPYLDFIKKHWRLTAEIAGIIVCLIIGFYLAPKPTVQIQEKIVSHETKVIDQQMVDQLVKQQVEEFKKNEKVHVVTVVVTKKDGTKVEKTTSDTQTDTTKTNTQVQTEVKVVHDVQYVDKIVEKQIEVKVTTPQPDWIVGIAVGPQIHSLTTLPDIYVGAEVDRRIIGPFYAGLSGGPTLSLPGGKPSGGQILFNIKATF